MHTLSARNAKALVDLGRVAGFDVPKLLAGLSFTEGDLHPYTAEIEWRAYLRLLERMEAAAGGPEPFDALLFEHGCRIVPELVEVGRLHPNARSYVRFLTTVMFPPTTPLVRSRYDELPDGRARVELALAATAEPSEGYFRVSIPMLRCLVAAKCGSPPPLEAAVHPRGGTYTLAFPDEPSVGRDGFDHGGWLALVAERAQVDVSSDPAAAAWVEQLERVLANVGASLVHASLVDADGVERVLRAHAPGEGVRVTGLVHDGRLVGWVRYVAPGVGAPAVHAAIEALAPGLAGLVGGPGPSAQVAEPELVARMEVTVAQRATLDAMPDAALLVAPDGSYRALNASAEAMLASPGRDGSLARVEAALEGARDAGVQVTRLDERGLPGHRIAFVRGSGAEAEARVERAREVWKLTPRQAEVLAAVARGLSNKEIGAALACAEVTVEQHVTQLFRKAGAHGRTALVARLWSLVP